jgi:hypothetical protein
MLFYNKINNMIDLVRLNANTVAAQYNNIANFENAGVAPVINGKAKLRVECPQKYWVKKYGFIKQTIPRHLHYRLIYPTGWTSEVLTKKLNC